MLQDQSILKLYKTSKKLHAASSKHKTKILFSLNINFIKIVTCEKFIFNFLNI